VAFGEENQKMGALKPEPLSDMPNTTQLRARRFGRRPFLFLAVIVVGGLILSTVRLVPNCTDQRTTDLVVQILRDQLGIKGDLSLHNVRQVSGGFFQQRYTCVPKLSGAGDENSLLTLTAKQVTYTSELTADTKRHYVTARLGLPRGGSAAREGIHPPRPTYGSQSRTI
jgi:hypothetical protein